MGWAHEISIILQKWVELPCVSLPRIHERNFLNINDFEIEELAQKCRELWGLGFAPVPDIILAMESAGIICIRDEIGYVKMDGVSRWYGERPFIFISSDKANGIRNRFDAAHELGHIILHRHVNTASYKKHYKEIERQANLFAGSFLLSASSFAQNIALTTLDGFLSIKPRWKVSLAAMIMRCYQLGIIDGDQKLRLYKSKSARGWATREPYDDVPAEQPRILHRSIKMLVENDIITKTTLLDELALPPLLCEQLCNLDSYFSENLGNIDNLVTLKFNKNRASNIISNDSSNIVNFPAR
jgi:Zn-dependent peptidase ImmA (M78 family)